MLKWGIYFFLFKQVSISYQPAAKPSVPFAALNISQGLIALFSLYFTWRVKPGETNSLTLALTATWFYFTFIFYHLLTHWLHTYLCVCPALSLLSLLHGYSLVLRDIWAWVVTAQHAAVLNFCFYFCICDRLVSRWEKFPLSSLLNFKHFVGHRCRSWHGFCLQGVSPTNPRGKNQGTFVFQQCTRQLFCQQTF